MYRVGTKVKVTNTGGPVGWDGEKYVGLVGTVIDHDKRDVGATAKDPLHIVRFSPRKVDGFWSEELEYVRPR